MRVALPGLLLAMVGGTAIRIALFGELTDYVKPSMRPWVLASGVVLAVVGVVGQMLAMDEPRDHGPRVALLLVVPLIVLAVIRPGPLTTNVPLIGANDRWSGPGLEGMSIPPGAYVGRRADPGAVVAVAVDAPLDRYLRAIQEQPDVVDGLAVRIVGQVDRADDGEVQLMRYKIFCCAADGLRFQVTLDVEDIPVDSSWVDGTWVEVSGVWEGEDLEVPVMRVANIAEIEQPDMPYLL